MCCLSQTLSQEFMIYLKKILKKKQSYKRFRSVYATLLRLLIGLSVLTLVEVLRQD